MHIFTLVIIQIILISLSFPSSLVVGLTVTLDLSPKRVKPLGNLDPRFLSFAIDSTSLVRGWRGINLTHPKLITLTKQLLPAYLRVGGTQEDSINFCPEENEVCNPPEADVNATSMQNLVTFVQKTGVELIYGLNILQRYENNDTWNPTNCVEVMEFLEKSMNVGGWELGNEPLRFPIVYNTSITPYQMAKDFNHLRTIISHKYPSKNFLILGPDNSRVKHEGTKSYRFLKKFLTNVDNSTLSGITFHDYYFDGHTSTVLNFLDDSIMDGLSQRIKTVKDLVKIHHPSLPIWLGETSSAWGGGSKNISDRYISNFMWLDKLGQSAVSGVSIVIRQTLTGADHSSYKLISVKEGNIIPTPSYFISLIFKRLVGSRVLNIPEFRKLRKLGARLYMHCTPDVKTSVVLYGMNIQSNGIHIRIKNSNQKKNLKPPVLIHEYLITGHENNNLLSKFCDLNGRLMTSDPHGFIPPLIPRILTAQNFTIPPTSMGFWILKNVNVQACME